MHDMPLSTCPMRDAAIEFLVYNPTLGEPVPETQKGVVVNPRLKERFKQFVPIGVYLEGADLKYGSVAKTFESQERVYSRRI